MARRGDTLGVVAHRPRRSHRILLMLLAEIEGQTHCVARYDSAHGTPHQDILGIRKGLLEKEWFFESSNREVLQYAIRDFKSHAADYICFYRAN